ncbi:TetR/AcrR family transcriptional regulator [Paenibacillus sp. SYP-B4298]|uniref:TetR/AcrR family transcriptional regulator n=1 Tax=Paenibacillus sp. SYP-B4298 TaxID=2996034 RepID=UPI0022DD211F|nr:helix-turn-helix domain containing protein [Paenibacillus sp. SYP-B4298]
MPEAEISLRELKKARSKLAIYEASLKLIEHRLFSEVMVEDICREAEVSRVTFFKFFSQKNDVLVYYMRIWLTRRLLDIRAQRLEGFAAIEHLFDQVAIESASHAGIMPSLISFLAGMQGHPAMPPLERAEIRLLFPKQEEEAAAVPSMYEAFWQAMDEAQRAGELRRGVAVDEAVQALFTIFYGSFLTLRLYEGTDVKGCYDAHLRLLKEWPDDVPSEKSRGD